MNINNLVNAFADRVAFGAMPDAKQATYYCVIVGHMCDIYSCEGLHDCITAFGCDDYICSGGFTCPDGGGGNDFTCYGDYVIQAYCSRPVPSVPCPGT